MESAPHLPEALKILFKALPRRRRRQAILALGLMLVGAGAEMLGISAVLVFLTLLTKPERLTESGAWHSIVGWLHYEPDPVLTATAGFIAVMLFSGAVRLALTWLTSSFSINAGLDFSAAAFRKVTSQPYKFYLTTGSDQILSRIEQIHITNSVILVGVQAVVASFVSLLIIIFLLFLDFWIATTLGIVLVGSYVAISLVARSTLSRNSQVVAGAVAERVKQIQQAVGGIRDILIDRSQWVFQLDFERSGNRSRRPQVTNSFMQYSPRILIEVIGMMAIVLLALALSRREGGLVGALPILGGLAIGAQRLLPLLQQSYYGWSMFFSNRQALLEVAGLLALPDSEIIEARGDEPSFDAAIEFDRVSFAYVEDRYVLRDVSVAIRKGERIGIIGTTGSGKSTLTDLLLGLLEPTKGRILVDRRELDRATLPAWQAQVAHVPQSIYLTDDTVARNIAFGVLSENVDMALVESAARSAGLHDFIVALPEQYETRCGERGIRLSGGQRQRIGIARALYKRATILVLDEATSALDNETEQAVMQSIAELSTDITVIMIAHRLTSLSECGRIFRVERGVVSEIPQGLAGIEKVTAGRRST
jgi:ABC-type bacteriocin/lantibiotic exporter with double-glycine peptidase domain